MRLKEPDGYLSPLGFVVWLFGLIFLTVTGLVGPAVKDGEPLLPRPLGIGIAIFLLCFWLASLLVTLHLRRTQREHPR